MTNFKVFMVLFLITLYHQWLPMITVVRGADEEFILKQCKAQETCLKCLNFDPRSKEANVNDLGLVNIIFDCMNYHASSMQDQMYMLNLNTTADAPTKQTYVDCLEWFTCAKSELFAARLGLEIGDYTTSSNSLYTAVMYRNSCSDALSKTRDFKDRFPQDMANELLGYVELYEAASKMLANYMYS